MPSQQPAPHQHAAPGQDVALVVRRLRPATFSIAVVLIVSVLLIQFIAIGSIFWLRSVTFDAVTKAVEKEPDKAIVPPPDGFVTPDATPGAGQGGTPVAGGDPNVAPMTLDGSQHPHTGGTAPAPAHTPATASTAPVQSYEPTQLPPPQDTVLTPAAEPGTESQTPRPTAMDPISSFDRIPSDATAEVRRKIHMINTEGLRLKELGDVDGAERHFHEALALDPKDANTLLKLAALYTDNNRKEDAKVYWQKVIELGPAIGAPYLAAKEAYALLVPPPPKIAIESALQKKLFIDKIERVGSNPTRPLNEFSMKVVIGANDLEEVDAGQVGIKLFFYDKMPDGKIAPSAAKLKPVWENSSPTWKKNNRETLTVNFSLNTPDGRECYGYVLRINYQGHLQDERIEPGALAELVAPAPSSGQPASQPAAQAAPSAPAPAPTAPASPRPPVPQGDSGDQLPVADPSTPAPPAP